MQGRISDRDLGSIKSSMTNVPLLREVVDESIYGRVLLANGHELPCGVKMIMPLQGFVSVNSTALINDVVVCALNKIGILVGVVTEVQNKGFRVAFRVKDHRRDKIASRIELHTAQAHRSAVLRQSPRFVPVFKSVRVWLSETLSVAGTILDISMSGAAITLQPDPGAFVGGLVRIESRLATVVRAIEGGIAVQFVEPFTAENFDERVRL